MKKVFAFSRVKPGRPRADLTVEETMPVDVMVRNMLPLVATSPRRVSEVDMRRFEGYVTEMFSSFGMDLNTPGTANTPRRFVQALHDGTAGYDGDPKLVTVFDSEYSGFEQRAGQIIEAPIPFFALCEHHALPFYGQAYVGYIADERIIGISKLTRLVRLYARRFTVQERMGRQIAETLENTLQPRGVAVYLEAHHLCTQMRGVQEAAPLTRTTFWAGDYEMDPTLRNEFMIGAWLARAGHPGGGDQDTRAASSAVGAPSP